MKVKSKIIFHLLLALRICAFAENAEDLLSDPEVITVRGEKTKGVEETASTTVVNHDDVSAHGDRTLDDSLKNVPGLQVATHRKGNVRVLFRGLDQNRISILLDGIPLNDVYSTDIDISNIPVSDISEISIMRGATSALYGASGGLGVINIITRKPKEAYAEAKVEYGQYQNAFLSASTGAPAGNFLFRVTGEYSHSGGYEVSQKLDKKKRREWFDKLVRYDLYGLEYSQVNLPAKDDYINDTGLWDHTEYDRCALSGRLSYSFGGSGEAGLQADYNFKKSLTNSYQQNAISNYRYTNGTWADPVFDVSADPMDIKNAAFRNRSFVWPAIHSVSVSPYFNYAFDRFEIKSSTFITYKKAEQEKYASTDESWPGDTALADTTLEPFLIIKEYLSCGTNVYPSVDLADWDRLRFAFLYRYNLYNESEQAISAVKSPAIASTAFGLEAFPVKKLDVSYFTAAVEDEMNLGKRVTLTAGISYDVQFFHSFKNREALYQFTDAYVVKNDSSLLGTKDSFNPVAGIKIEAVKDHLDLKAACSMKTRFPDLSEYALIVDDKRDNGLKPERSYNINAGFETFVFKKMLSFRTDYYISRVMDRIEKITGGIDPPVNIGEVRSQGFESTFSFTKKKLAEMMDLDASLSYTYLHARSLDNTPEEKVNKGDLLEYTPAHQICAEIRLWFISDTGINIWGYSTINQIVYVMKERPVTAPAVIPFSTRYFKAVQLHNPVMLNARISQKLFTRFTVYITCKNILDDYNADPFIPGPGRMFYIGGSAEF